MNCSRLFSVAVLALACSVPFAGAIDCTWNGDGGFPNTASWTGATIPVDNEYDDLAVLGSAARNVSIGNTLPLASSFYQHADNVPVTGGGYGEITSASAIPKPSTYAAIFGVRALIAVAVASRDRR